MQLHVKVAYLKALRINSPQIEGIIKYRTSDQFADINASEFSEAQLDALYKMAADDAETKVAGARGLCTKITSYRNIRANPTGKKIGRLEVLSAALHTYIETAPNKWLFKTEADGHATPYFVESIAYEKGDVRRGSQASVRLKLAAITRGQDDGRPLTFYQADLGATASEILNSKGYYLETPEAVAQYWQDIELYKKWCGLTGKQFTAIGTAFPQNYYSYGEIAMERDGRPSKVVMDDATDDAEQTRSREATATASTTFWGRQKPKNDEDTATDEDDDEGSSVAKPVHPYVKAFDLQRHEYVQIHVRNLAEYKYDKTAATKLVLDSNTKDLITILVRGSAEVMEDIIAGKTGGTIVLCSGPPGCGKTLTAEVYTEAAKRPLYLVQCSQLGTDEESLERRLGEVLERATRWRAILLIDEADVYVHSRGEDIQQNAIVGVFLRLLEYYNGILFMTTNRATVIDDAILSRATAWLKYDYPSRSELKEIWQVLAAQYDMAIPDQTIHDLCIEFSKISGRNVKNMLKLARMLANNSNRKIDLDLFKYVSRFLDLRLAQGDRGD
jgi:hypothetical protein